MSIKWQCKKKKKSGEWQCKKVIDQNFTLYFQMLQDAFWKQQMIRLKLIWPNGSCTKSGLADLLTLASVKWQCETKKKVVDASAKGFDPPPFYLLFLDDLSWFSKKKTKPSESKKGQLIAYEFDLVNLVALFGARARHVQQIEMQKKKWQMAVRKGGRSEFHLFFRDALRWFLETNRIDRIQSDPIDCA